MAKFEASQLEFTHSITDSAGTSWCYRLIKRHEYATQESIKMLPESCLMQRRNYVLKLNRQVTRTKFPYISAF